MIRIAPRSMLFRVFLTGLLLSSNPAEGAPLFSGQGQAKTSTMAATLIGGATFNGTYNPAQNNLSFAQYLEVKFSCGLDGYQAIIVFTDNSSTGASPRYTGGGSGSGLVYVQNTTSNAALHWVIFDNPVAQGYTFTPGADPNAEPVETDNQFFVADKKENPFPAGYASFVYDLNGYAANMANAPDVNRVTTDGLVYIYLGANLKFMPAGDYKSSTLTVQLVTINPDQTLVVHQSQSFTVQATR